MRNAWNETSWSVRVAWRRVLPTLSSLVGRLELSRADANTKLANHMCLSLSCSLPCAIPVFALLSRMSLGSLDVTILLCLEQSTPKNVRPLKLFILCCVVRSFFDWLLNTSSQACCWIAQHVLTRNVHGWRTGSVQLHEGPLATEKTAILSSG